MGETIRTRKMIQKKRNKTGKTMRTMIQKKMMIPLCWLTRTNKWRAMEASETRADRRVWLKRRMSDCCGSSPVAADQETKHHCFLT